MASVAGVLPTTVDRILRNLRTAKLAPMGRHGRGQEYGQFDASHLASIIFGFAAALPSGAANAVRALTPLHAENPEGGFAPGDVAEELGANLINEIQARAKLILSGDTEKVKTNEEKWELTLCLNPVMAWENWATNGIEHHKYYRTIEQINLPNMPHPQEFNPGVRRLTVITLNVLNAAAELYGDLLSRNCL